MTKVIKKPQQQQSTPEKLIDDIRNICLKNPQSDLAVWIKNMIDGASVPMQMDRDLIRRLTNPVCNVHDVAFSMPHAMLETDYEKINNQILIEQ